MREDMLYVTTDTVCRGGRFVAAPGLVDGRARLVLSRRCALAV
jgi:hypothetical protein